MIDNPPFSILAEIKRFYHEKNIKYFLFAPHLTLFSAKGEGERYIITDSDVIYENGAKVMTSFVTNMDRYKIRTAPELAEAIDRAVEEGRERAPEMPAYDYPLEVVTAARLARIARVDFKVLPEHCHFTRQLDSQKETGAALYGAGYLIAEKAAAEKAAAEKAAAREVQVWELSEREKEIIKSWVKRMLAKTYRKRIIKSMEALGTYKPEFSQTINELATMLEDLDKTREKFEESGGNVVVIHTNKKRKQEPRKESSLSCDRRTAHTDFKLQQGTRPHPGGAEEDKG